MTLSFNIDLLYLKYLLKRFLYYLFLYFNKHVIIIFLFLNTVLITYKEEMFMNRLKLNLQKKNLFKKINIS